jgi:23S rRNA pseudouridine2604 synthase
MKSTKIGAKSGKESKREPKEKIVLVRRQPKITNQANEEAKTSVGLDFDGKVRLNKKIKDLGLASRRDADKLIEKGLVTVNGKVAEIGKKVKPEDKIEIKNIKNIQDSYLYYTFYKPKDIMSHSPQYGEQEVKNFFPNWDKDGLTIVGRLDKHSEGLMLVTNDKRLVERILDPKFEHERVYEVEVQEKLSNNIVALFKKGFEVRGRFQAKPAKVEILNNFNMRITLTEGKKHQIRLMLNELHYTVFNLRRVMILNLTLKNLSPGTFKPVGKPEILTLLQTVGLK